jgi:hypothetical protein
MKRSCAGLFLLFVSFLIPLNVAYLYQDYYEDIDFLARKHFTAQDEEDLLTVLKKNPRIFNDPEPSLGHDINLLLDISPLKVFSAFSAQELTTLVIRC